MDNRAWEYFAVPFCSNETHTMYFNKEAILGAELEQENITEEQVRQIYETEGKEMNPNWDLDTHIANIMHWRVKANGNVVSDFMYRFDKLAIISLEYLDEIDGACRAMWKLCKGDTSAAKACANFHELCEDFADKVIDIKTNALIEEL